MAGHTVHLANKTVCNVHTLTCRLQVHLVALYLEPSYSHCKHPPGLLFVPRLLGG
jgi:hypothetical protein